MRLNLCSDLIAGFLLDSRSGAMYGRHGQSKQNDRDGFNDFIPLVRLITGVTASQKLLDES